MKKLYLVMAILFFGQQMLYAAQDTTLVTNPGDSVKIELGGLKKEIQVLAEADKGINDAVDTLSKKINANSACVYRYNAGLNFGEWLIVFLPLIIFILVITILLYKGLAKFDLTEALKENDLTKVVVPNPYYRGLPSNAGQTDVPTTIEITANVTIIPALPAGSSDPANNALYEINDEVKTYRPSISRFIAFISSFLIIIIAVCMSSFFIYHYLKTGCPPELGSFTTVLIALGIGIVPYAANRVSAAVSTNKSEA